MIYVDVTADLATRRFLLAWRPLSLIKHHVSVAPADNKKHIGTERDFSFLIIPGRSIASSPQAEGLDSGIE